MHYTLQKFNFVIVFPINSLTLARYRQAMFSSGAKDDPLDAELALGIMLNYPNKVNLYILVVTTHEHLRC